MRAAGVTPWAMVMQVDKFWRRTSDGGAVAAFRLGPKEVREEYVACELFDVPYFRRAFRGVLQAFGDLFCSKGYVHELPRRARGEANYRAQWT